MVVPCAFCIFFLRRPRYTNADNNFRDLSTCEIFAFGLMNYNLQVFSQRYLYFSPDINWILLTIQIIGIKFKQQWRIQVFFSSTFDQCRHLAVTFNLGICTITVLIGLYKVNTNFLYSFYEIAWCEQTNKYFVVTINILACNCVPSYV